MKLGSIRLVSRIKFLTLKMREILYFCFLYIYISIATSHTHSPGTQMCAAVSSRRAKHMIAMIKQCYTQK